MTAESSDRLTPYQREEIKQLTRIADALERVINRHLEPILGPYVSKPVANIHDR